jgi:predicted transcriptional regulator
MDDNTSLAAADRGDMIGYAADIVSAYVSNNSVPTSELPGLLSGIYAAIDGLRAGSASAEPAIGKPTAAQIRKSIKPDALISFIDGKPYKTLKRHLSGNGLTIAEYRERYGLPRDYPSVAASYSEQRSAMAKNLGLGQNRKASAPVAPVEPAAAPAEKPVEKPTKARGRAKVAEAPAPKAPAPKTPAPKASKPAEEPAKGRRTKKPAAVA